MANPTLVWIASGPNPPSRSPVTNDRWHDEDRCQDRRDERLGDRRHRTRDRLHELEDQRPILDLRADDARADHECHQRTDGPDDQRVNDRRCVGTTAADTDEDAEQRREPREEAIRDRPSPPDERPERQFDDRAERPHRRTR
jgi:hypothetical protein